MVQLQVKNQTDNNPSFLDLGDVSIKADFSVLEIQDITKRKSENTQAFTLPFTQTNNNFFSHFYDVTASGDFNANKKTEASIIVDSIEVIEGYLQLLSVNTTSQTYEVIVYGLVANIVNQLAESKLNDLDLSEFNHVLNIDNVTDSWDGAITYTDASTGDEILYPIIDYGFGYDKNSLESDSTTNFNNPIICENLKPTIKVRTVFEKILRNIGYNAIDSDFNGSSFFDKQYMTLGTTKENIDNAPEDSFRIGKTTDQDIDTSASTTNPYDITFDDLTAGQTWWDGNNNLNASGNYVAATDGFHKFELDLNYTTTNTGTQTHVGLTVYIDIDGTIQEVIRSRPLAGTNKFISYNTDLIYLEAGQTVKMRVYYSGAPSNSVFRILSSGVYFNSQTSWKLVEAPTSNIGTTVKFGVGNNLLPDITQIDFLKSILSRYNLVMVPSKFSGSLIVIEPIQDYFDDGLSKDWTDKIDNSKAITIKPTYEFQKDKIIFKDLEGDDYITQMYEKAKGKTYNYRKVDIDSDFKQKGNNFELESVFSSFTTDKIDETNFILPRLYQTENEQIERVITKPKIFYYSGKKNIDEWYLWESTSSATPNSQTQIPFCSSFSMAGNSIEETDFDIRYETGEAIGEKSYLLGYPKENTFNKYWQQYLDNIFNKDARILIGNFKLNSVDIANLKYNDKIFVKDSFYRVNKVSNYAFGKDVSTRVELIKVLDYFDTLSIAGCDLKPTSVSLYGIVSFTDPITGTVSGGNKTCCEANNFTWYGFTSNCVVKRDARINTQPPTAQRSRINNDTSLGRSARKTKIKGDVTEFADSENATDGQVAKWNATEGKVEWTNSDEFSDVLYFGTGTTVANIIYYLKADGSWETTTASTTSRSVGLIALALGTNPSIDGMLLKGKGTIFLLGGSSQIGTILYLSESTYYPGIADTVPPSASGEVVRIIGYSLASGSSNVEIFFNPSQDWIELA